MLRVNYQNRDFEDICIKIDDEFETMEEILLNALEIVEEYERQIETSKISH